MFECLEGILGHIGRIDNGFSRLVSGVFNAPKRVGCHQNKQNVDCQTDVIKKLGGEDFHIYSP